jgi:dTDP-glucose 4,6-dehydratase/UDP-glucuronate decarboxylase
MTPADRLGSDPLALIADDCAHVAERLGTDAERFAGKTVLVTGATGMLPAHVVDALAHLNDAGRLSAPLRLLLVARDPGGNEGRLLHLRGRSDVRFITADASRPYPVDEPVHFWVHAASPASPAAYRADPVGTLAVNSAGLQHVLERAREGGAESVLFFSTSEVYGTPPAEHIPTPESYVGTTPWLGGRACYVEAKRFGEALCAAEVEQHGTPVKIVRPFHVHGPGLRLSDSRIVAALIRMGIEGEPFSLMSAGRATRTYGYVSDATFAFLKVLLSGHDGTAFNVGAAAPETSMLELATVVSRLFGRDEPVRTATDPGASHLAGAPDRVRPDLSRLRDLLGVEPVVSLEEGLARTIHWHRTRLAAAGR